MKIGVGIITFNSENYYKDLYNSLQDCEYDELVTVNGGKPYEQQYNSHWIQHSKNFYPAVCRNDCVSFLMNRNCDHIFLIEDDMIIKNKNIFKLYIKASQSTGLKYFSYVSTSWESGSPGNRTPRLTVQYDDVSISFYKNMCNEFTYHHKSCFEQTGLYDSQFRDPFDIDRVYRESKQSHCAPFWWFADITNSDEYIQNNPIAVSRLQSDRPDGSRQQRIQEQWKLFHSKHKLMVKEIPDTSRDELIKKLKKISPK